MIKAEPITIPSEDDSHHGDSDESHDETDDDDSAYGKPKKDPIAVKFKKEVHKVLKCTKCKSSDFAISKELTSPPILVIEIEGVGKVHFPVYEEEAKSIIERFDQSPFGKRSQTVIDVTVRNSKQLEPDSFKILNPNWDSYVNQEILTTISDEMYIKTAFKASLYKLLLYEPGSFFKPHRDTEKEKGMFGTLIVQLPSRYFGGDLLITHENKKKCFNFSSNSSSREFSMFFAAFYCDCQHEVLPITDGYRICLVYNLVSTQPDIIPQTPKFIELEDRFLDITKDWIPSKPTKVVYALAHKYTESSISFANLKGTDRSVAAFLKFCAEKASLKLSLALFTKKESGGADGSEHDFELVDCDTEYSLTNLVSFSNEKSQFKELSVNYENEVIPTNCFKDVAPDKEEFQEYSGNEGASAERWYWGAAIVFWQEQQTASVLAQTDVNRKLLVDSYFNAYNTHPSNPEDKGNSEVFQWLHAIINDESHEYQLLDKDLILRLLDSVVSFDDFELLKQALKKFRFLDVQFLPRLIEMCVPKYGWKALSQFFVDICKSAYKLDKLWDAFELLKPENSSSDLDKRNILLECLKTILEKTKNSWSCFRYEEQEQVLRLFSFVTTLKSLPLLLKLLDVDHFKFVDPYFAPSLLEQCQSHGWKSLGPAIFQMFSKCENCDKAMDVIELLVPEERVSDLEKKEVLHQSLTAIISREKEPLDKRLYNRQPRTSDVKLLYFKIYISAKKLDFTMVDYAKANPILHAEVLLQLSAVQSFSASTLWIDSAKRVAQSLQFIISEKLPNPCLSRNESWSCNCADCITVKKFLKSLKECETFKMGRQRSLHLEKYLKMMVDINCEVSLVKPQSLIVKKTQTAFKRKRAEADQAAFLLTKIKLSIESVSKKLSSSDSPKKIKFESDNN